ncbi:hypothetical protein Bca4012_035366 [Brassica carinata]
METSARFIREGFSTKIFEATRRIGDMEKELNKIIMSGEALTVEDCKACVTILWSGHEVRAVSTVKFSVFFSSCLIGTSKPIGGL